MSGSNNPAVSAMLGQKKTDTVVQQPEPIFRPDAIYFDTNPLIASGWPTPSAQFTQILNEADRLGFPVCLPEVVHQELEAHWIRDLERLTK